MTHFSDHERQDHRVQAKQRFDHLWRYKLILDSTYLRSLFIIGYLPDEARTELNLLKMEKR